MKQHLLWLLLCILIGYSCKKEEENTAKTLAGTWQNIEITSYVNDSLIFHSTNTLNYLYFDECQISNFQYCSGASKENSQDIGHTFLYQIINEGKTLIIDNDNYRLTTDDQVFYTIEQLSKKELLLSQSQIQDSYNQKINIKFIKIN